MNGRLRIRMNGRVTGMCNSDMSETISSSLSEPLKKALTIIRDRKPERPSDFAFLMWGDSPKWQNTTKAGKNGVSKGGGMNLAAGGYLGKLKSQGLIVISIGKFGNVYRLTPKAIQLLKEDNLKNYCPSDVTL